MSEPGLAVYAADAMPQLLHPKQAWRHEVCTGITGWAQFNGCNALSWEPKFALNVRYVDHLPFSLDLKTMALTVSKILKREGISQPGEVTAGEFMGSES